MVNNDYYNQSSSRNDPYYSHQTYESTASYTHPHSQQPISSVPPSYASNGRPSPPPAGSATSPFEAPFDDHVYPMPGRPGYDHSQSSFSQDSTYYGQGGGGRPQDSNLSFRSEAPLRPQKPLSEPEETDHVYDAGEAGIPLRDRRQSEARRQGFGFLQNSKKGRHAWVVYAMTLIQCCVFIAEIAKNAQLTGSPIEIHPTFNPMIGPSSYVMINMGARFVPCMHNVEGIQDSTTSIAWPCPNTTSSSATDPSNQCTLSELCGFSGVPNPTPGGSINDTPEPNQWYRFILPMFLHAGFIHIGFNLLLQCTLGREMEIAIGSVRFFLVYVASGIFGFVLGGNFAATGIASTGCSGCLFGIIAINLLDLLYTWHQRKNPWRDFAYIAVDVVISFVLGLLPGLDNFSHIGGFLMGIVLGICILHSPALLRERVRSDDPPYTPVGKVPASDADRPDAGVKGFLRNPVGFFKGRKGAWWAWWLIRAGALVAVLIVFILLLNNFYIYRKTCSWCKYLSCLPINNWCSSGNLQLSNTTSKRSVFENWNEVGMAHIMF